MSWSGADEAQKIYKFLKNGVLEPEDLTRNEFRLLKKYHHDTYLYVKCFLENRMRKIEAGEWSEECEPPDNERRIKRYEQGDGIVPIWHPQHKN